MLVRSQLKPSRRKNTKNPNRLAEICDSSPDWPLRASDAALESFFDALLGYSLIRKD